MSHYQLKLKERRISERKKLTGLLPGKLQITGKDVIAKPVDISEHGLGLLMSAEFKIGAKAELILKDSVIPFEVKWIEPDFGKNDMWRYGIVCTDTAIDIISIFAKTGCLK